MKKSLLLLGAACIALSSAASIGNKAHQRPSTPKFSFERNLTMKDDGAKTLRHNSGMKKAPAKVGSAEDVIYEIEGKRQNMAVTCSGFSDYDGWTFEFEEESYASHVVYGENNEVYIYNILPQIPIGSYVKGKKEGDKIVVDLPQTVLWDDEFEDGADLTLCDYYEIEEDGEIYYDFAPTEETTLTFSIGEDGTWTADGLEPEHIIAYTFCTDGYWTGYGAWQLSLEPFNGTPVTVPDDIEVSENFWTYKCDYIGYGWPVSFAQGGEEVYFQGLSSEMPDAWVKATVEYDDSEAHVYIDQNQYVGIYEGSFVVTKCAKILYDEEWDEEYYELMPDDYRFELIWDYEEEKMVVKDPSVALLFNRSTKEVYYADELFEFELIMQDSYEGTPANPYNLVYFDWMDEYDYSVLEFYAPAISTDGYVLDTNDLYYVVYANGEPLTFEDRRYQLDGPTEEIPWTFENDNFTIIKNYGSCRHAIYIFVEGVSTIGVQSVYKYDGVETRSEIVSLDLEGSAVEGLNADKKVANVKYYDVAGREVSKPASGLCIKRTTYSDGTVSTLKNIAH